MSNRSLPILLVEDNPMDIELTLRAFKKHKISNPITVARDGEEALDYIHRRGRFAHDAPVPALILLDIRLPKLDGIDVLREIKAHPVYRTVPVVILTTSENEVDIQNCYTLGANSFILKPVEFNAFFELTGRIELYWLLTNVPPLAATRTSAQTPAPRMPQGSDVQAGEPDPPGDHVA